MKNTFNIYMLPILIVGCLAIFSLFELTEDIANNDNWLESSFEFALIAICAFLIILYRKNLTSLVNILTDSNKSLSDQVLATSIESEEWRLEAQNVLRDLNEKINLQFLKWGLSSAEKRVAIELLKGLSHKEIGNLRQSSEKTVRIQAASVYRKANIDGRAQLAAFFLDGLQVSEEKA